MLALLVLIPWSALLVLTVALCRVSADTAEGEDSLDAWGPRVVPDDRPQNADGASAWER